MNRELEATGLSEVEMPTISTRERTKTFTYAGYAALDGRIDEVNYTRVMKKVRENESIGAVDGFAIDQTKITADISGISLDAIRNETGVDPRTIYGILRRDIRPPGTEYHHDQMSDQQLLVEALRMLEQESAVSAVIKRHPHIQFQ